MDQNLIIEAINFIEGVKPVDLSVAGATGDFVALKKYRRCGILLAAGPGAVGEPVTLTVQQAQDSTGTGAKALNFTVVYFKAQPTDMTLTDAWTKTTQTAANTFQPTSDGSKDKLVWVEFKDSDLDMNNGFTFLRATVADPGVTAQLGYLLYVMAEPRFGPSDPVSAETAIA